MVGACLLFPNTISVHQIVYVQMFRTSFPSTLPPFTLSLRSHRRNWFHWNLRAHHHSRSTQICKIEWKSNVLCDAIWWNMRMFICACVHCTYVQHLRSISHLFLSKSLHCKYPQVFFQMNETYGGTGTVGLHMKWIFYVNLTELKMVQLQTKRPEANPFTPPSFFI